MKLSFSEFGRLAPIAKRRIGEKLVRLIHKLFNSERVVKDIFGTEREHKALICYLPEAFKGKELPKHHSNFTECHTAAEALHRLGYSVNCGCSRAKSMAMSSPLCIIPELPNHSMLLRHSEKSFFSSGVQTLK